jgi:fermentation-respiration switch protein FrsA (DUF1100 family)
MRSAPVAPLLLLAACPTAPTPPSDVLLPAFCEGGRASFVYDPDPSAPLGTFPDDRYTVEADTATGLRVDLPSDHPAVGSMPSGYANVFDELSTLDGWGVTAGAVFRFDRPIDVSKLDDSTMGFVALTDAGPIRVAADVRSSDFGAQVILLPRVPLPAATRCAAAIFEPVTSLDGSCVRLPEAMEELLTPGNAGGTRYADALAGFGRIPEDVVAMTVFTTQSAPAISHAVAETIRASDPPAFAPWDCQPSGPRTRCESSIAVLDFRDENRVIPPDSVGDAHGNYVLPVSLWLPETGTPPYPLVVYGHGLGSGRGQGNTPASLLGPEGYAVIAIDAVQHGDHPGRTSLGVGPLDALTFFAIQIDPPGISGIELRDNFRQSTYDKLQLLEAMSAGIDVDIDGISEIDPQRLVYVGVSLGGIMGAEVLSLTDRFVGALLSVPGGRTSAIIQDSETFRPLIDIMRPEGTPEADVERFFPILQTLIDPGDAMTWAARVLPGREMPPQVLVQVALNDTIVPNSANDAFVRALGAPGVGREVWPVAGIGFEPGPIVGNLDGDRTAAVTQFDIVHEDGDPLREPVPAGHDNVTTSYEGWEAATDFLEPVLAGEPGVARDPYVE